MKSVSITKPMMLLATLLIILSTFTNDASFARAEETTDTGDNSNVEAAAAGDGAASTNTKFSAQELFHKLDANHDSSLSLADFERFDKNQDAKISMGEFTSAIGSEGSVGASGDETGGFVKGFTSSTAMIIATEIGDKTFFIAAVLSMRHPRLTIFAGAILALICMTILSTMMGLILPSLLPRQYTHIIGGILFLYFGIKLIYDSRSMSDKVSDELEEVEEELGCNKKNDEHGDSDSGKAGNETSVPLGNDSKQKAGMDGKSIFLQAFLLTFLAEWGDRSQIATIALAAAKDPYGVTLGGCFGHSLCTGMAVVGGRMLASRISEKTVSFWGGMIFLAFGVHSFVFDM